MRARSCKFGGAVLTAAGFLLATAALAQQPAGHQHGGEIGFKIDESKTQKPNLPVGPQVVYFPEYDEGVATLPARRAAQLAAAKQITVFHGFRFTDRLPESGITFRHQGTDDSGIHYKAVHYDHGNGVVTADVDEIGRAHV